MTSPPQVGTAPQVDGSVAPARTHDTVRVSVRGLRVSFDRVEAVGQLDLEVNAGRVSALVGGNGAGKSTTLRVIAGVVPVSAGEVSIDGVEITQDPLRAKQLTGYCPDVGGLVPRATPWEHFQLAARLRRMTQWQARAEDLLVRFELEGVADRVTSGFSHGMSRRLSVALAGFHRPAALLLDEPFDGVDPLGVDATMALITELRDAGSAVIVSTHLLELAVSVADDAVVLRRGRAVAHCPASELSGRAGSLRYRDLLSA